MPNPLIYYIRHGQTDWNAELRYQGRQDIPLNLNGKEQARRNGQKLRELLGEKPDIPFIASPMVRTRQTMDIILEELGFEAQPYDTDERLVEAFYGEWEGKTLPQVKLEYQKLHRERKQSRWYFHPPGGGESHQDTFERVSAWHDSIQQDSVVVAHGQVGRALRFHLLDLEQQDAGMFVFPQDKICVIRRGHEEFE